jgi:hypothetical protein
MVKGFRKGGKLGKRDAAAGSNVVNDGLSCLASGAGGGLRALPDGGGLEPSGRPLGNVAAGERETRQHQDRDRWHYHHVSINCSGTASFALPFQSQIPRSTAASNGSPAGRAHALHHCRSSSRILSQTSRKEL